MVFKSAWKNIFKHFTKQDMSFLIWTQFLVELHSIVLSIKQLLRIYNYSPSFLENQISTPDRPNKFGIIEKLVNVIRGKTVSSLPV